MRYIPIRSTSMRFVFSVRIHLVAEFVGCKYNEIFRIIGIMIEKFLLFADIGAFE